MDKLKNWLEDKIFWLKTGIRTETANGGKPIDQVVIRYKDFFFMIDIDVESGEPTGDFGWSEGTPMTPILISNFYTAVKETPRCNTGCRTAKCQGVRQDEGRYVNDQKAAGRTGHKFAPPGKRVMVTLHSGEQFVAKFKEKTGKFHHFTDHDRVRSASIRQLSILNAAYGRDES